MERDEEKVIDQNTVPAPEDNVEVLNPEEETLAQTDEVIPPAPVDPVTPEIPVDTIPASTTIPLTVDETPVEEPVVDAPVEEPIPEPVAEPVADAPVEDPVNDIPSEPEPVISDVVPDAGDETPLDAPVEEPIASDVVPEVGDESPTDVAVPGECPNCEGEGCPTCDSDGNRVAGLFGTMQEAVTIIWKYHLKTRKFSIHIALNDFYHQMLHLVDDVIEQYQGIHGIIDGMCPNCVYDNGVSEYDYLNNLRAYIENNRGLAGTESEIQSAFDDILGLIDTTLYKINNLTESAVKSFDEFVYEDYVGEGHCCGEEEDEDDEYPLDDNGNPGKPGAGGEYTDEEEE